MPKKILLFLSIFIGLGLLAWFLYLYGKPTAANLNPLVSVDVEKINKIKISDSNFSISAEKKGTVWYLTAPINDVADSQLVDRIVATIKGFSIGSVVSENKNRFPQFEIEDNHALAVQISADKDTAPRLDLLLGKEGPRFGTTFVRFRGKDAVYLGENLPSYLITRSSGAYRSKNLIQAAIDSTSKINFKLPDSEFALAQSSQAWTVMISSRIVDPSIITLLKSKIIPLQSQNLVTKNDLLNPSGLEKPQIEMEFISTLGVERIVIGQKIPAKTTDLNLKGQHYATVEGRDSILVLSDEVVKDLFDLLKTIPK